MIKVTRTDTIPLPGGWRFEPCLHPTNGSPTGYAWLIRPNGLQAMTLGMDDAQALAAAIARAVATGEVPK